MPTQYKKADHTVYELLNEVRSEHHNHLRDVDIDLFFAVSDDDYPMISKGMRVLGKTRKIENRLRDYGLSMIIIELDYEFWESSTDEVRKALLDHELCHIDEPEEDRQGRLQVKLRHHDYELTGFAACIRRHGADAIESIENARHAEAYAPLFDFAKSRPSLKAVTSKAKKMGFDLSPGDDENIGQHPAAAAQIIAETGA